MNYFKDCLLCSIVFLTIEGRAQTKITAQKLNSKIDITINNNFFTSYIFSQDEKYRQRAFQCERDLHAQRELPASQLFIFRL